MSRVLLLVHETTASVYSHMQMICYCFVSIKPLLWLGCSVLMVANISSPAPCAAEELALSLSEALSSGDGQEAARLCQRLAQLSVPVSVSVDAQAYPRDSIRWARHRCAVGFRILARCFQNREARTKEGFPSSEGLGLFSECGVF